MTKRWVAAWLVALLALGGATAARAQYGEQAQFGTATGTNAIALTVPAIVGNTPPSAVPLRFVAPAAPTGAVTIALNGGSALAVKKWGSAGLAAFIGGEWQPGFLVSVIFDGTQYQLAAAAQTQSSVQGAYKNLKVVHTGNTASTITADAVTLSNGSGSYATVGPVNCSINWAASGSPAQLDAGSLANSTWYYDYVIWNGFNHLLPRLGLGDIAHAADGIYLLRSGGRRYDRWTAHLMRAIQFGRSAQYVVTPATNTANLPAMASGTAGSLTTPTYVAVATGGFAPPTAASIIVAGSAPGQGGHRHHRGAERQLWRVVLDLEPRADDDKHVVRHVVRRQRHRHVRARKRQHLLGKRREQQRSLRLRLEGQSVMRKVIIALLALLWAAPAWAGFAYSNNGLSWRACDQANIVSGEVWFAAPATSDQLTSSFPGYAAAMAAQTAQGTFNTAIGAGLAITSTGTPALNATYALDATSQAQLYQIAIYAQTFGVFPNGQSTMAYPDATGAPHTFNPTQIANLLKAVAPYVSSLNTTLATIEAGGSASWPTPSATIP